MTGKGNGQPGLLFVVSAPSGAGKTTICNAVRRRFPDLRYSVSTTTRPPRPCETDGVDYHFISEEDFEEKIADGRWAEWARVHGRYYGTSADFLEAESGRGRDVLLDIDVQGAAQIVARYPDSVTIFIMPPSETVLRRRLETRGTEPADAIEKRLATAVEEMRHRNRYRHVVVNDDLEAAIAAMTAIISDARAASGQQWAAPRRGRG